jgi:hypothetical protein
MSAVNWTSVSAGIVVAATAILVIAALVVFPVGGTAGSACAVQPSSYGRSYCGETVALNACQGTYDCRPVTPVEFHGVSFSLSVIGGGNGGSPAVSGSVVEGNQTTFHLTLLGNPLGPQSVNWTSPDLKVLIIWDAPFESTGTGGVVTAQVTCAVLSTSTDS